MRAWRQSRLLRRRPQEMWFIFYALAQGGYIASGGAYIKGGSRQLSLKLAKAITKAGGVVRLGRAVTAIETDAHGHVSFVRHVARKAGDNEERIDARFVMANCAPSVASGLLTEPARIPWTRPLARASFRRRSLRRISDLRAKPSTIGLTDYSTIILPQGHDALRSIWRWRNSHERRSEGTIAGAFDRQFHCGRRRALG